MRPESEMITCAVPSPIFFESRLLPLWSVYCDENGDALNFGEWFIRKNDVRFLSFVLSVK